ncbi:WxL domain-containing protein [Levilactobacillus angrenensis]|uniref:WxL domain-containing protein n=1 Tax=Levilactobacillus angrenensis TaxID=2486020 RepID=A0ABW1U6T8_9LACO|nr:WxL domain-containing protein [Levilactobacillus angrenensis]
MFKRWLSAGLILLAVCLGSSGVLAHADSDLDQALATAPQGIFLDKTNAFVTTETTNKSSATVMDGKNEATPGTDVVALTSGARQFGSMWSLDAGKFDLYQDHELSAWLYLGNQGVKAEGGLAFVLQNDWWGLTAMPAKGKAAIPAETLGVWGIDTDSRQSSEKSIAETAIQNSWALEFDAGYNGVSGKVALGQANAFDGAETGAHIANNYPSQATTYLSRLVTSRNRDYFYFNMAHHGQITDVNHPNFLANGQWHHVTLNWDYKAEMLTYSFDDRNPVTGERQPGQSRSERVFPYKLDPYKTGQVRWGFTATSGSRVENNLVILENVPGLVSARGDLTVTNLSQKQAVAANDQVLSGDRLQLDYQLKYHGGRQPWRDILANLALPTDFTPDDITITYQDAKLPPQRVALRELRDQRLSVRLREALNTANTQATIRVVGQVDQVKQCTPVVPTTSTFTSPTQTCAVDSPKYFINPHADLDLQVTSDNPVKLAAGADTTVTGTVKSTLPSDQLQIKPVLNSQSLPTVMVKDGQFTLPLKSQQLQAGTNELILRAVTSAGDESAPVTVTLTVAGELKFSTVSPEENFQSARLTGQSQFIKRAGHWQLAVRDTRGTGERWTLTAAATPFVAKDAHGAQLVGQPVYVTDYQRIPILPTPTAVYTHETDDSVADGEVDVAGSWRDDTGVLLHVQSASLSGQYQGTITWALTDAPQ